MPQSQYVLDEPIPDPLRRELIEDARSYRFARPDPRAGGAFAMADLTEIGSPSGRFATWLKSSPASSRVHPFSPNEASYQRYTNGGNGLPPHRDQRYYLHAIAIVTLEGEAAFALHGSADRLDVIAEWWTSPGQVVLLPGWDPAAPSDTRLYHRVDPPRTPHRLMLQLRQNLAADPASGQLHSKLTTEELQQALELMAIQPAKRMS